MVSQVRYGERVYSSLMARGSADVLLSLELLEAARHLEWLSRDGVLLANLQRITPAPVGGLLVDYPDDPRALCEERVERALFLPALAVAADLGQERAANMVMLGAFSVFSEGIATGLWERVIADAFRPAFRETNLRAFAAGRA